MNNWYQPPLQGQSRSQPPHAFQRQHGQAVNTPSQPVDQYGRLIPQHNQIPQQPSTGQNAPFHHTATHQTFMYNDNSSSQQMPASAQVQPPNYMSAPATAPYATAQPQKIDCTKLLAESSQRPKFDRTAPLQKLSAGPSDVAQSQSSASTSSKTTVTTKKVLDTSEVEYDGGNFGGEARQAAAAQSEASLRRFDKQVQEMLMSYSEAICPMGFRYDRCRMGYLCEGAHHFVSHAEVDAMIAGRRPLGPRIEIVNSIGMPFRWVTPSPTAWHEHLLTSRSRGIEPFADLRWPGNARYWRN